MKKTLYLILIFIALTLAYLKFTYGGVATPVSIPSPSPTPFASAAPLTRTFSTEFFTLAYPLEASASAESESVDYRSWRVYYMGDKQRESGRTQTELFDGYILSITRYESVGEELANSQAETDRTGIIDACGEENVTAIEQKSFLSRETVHFFGGCLGEADYYYFLEGDSLFRLTSMVVGDDLDQEKYRRSVEQIIASLEFIE